MSDPTLDLGIPDAPLPVEQPSLSADKRRIQRQAEAITRGVHPLALIDVQIRMHPDADRQASRSDGPRLPLRCGTCVHRMTSDRGYPNCDLGPSSRGAATDARAWWPACTRYTTQD